MPETCPASGSFGEPNFRNVFLLSVLSSNTGQKVSAEHFLSRRGKKSQSPSPSPSVVRCCRNFSVSRQHSVLRRSRTGVPGFPRAFGVFLGEQELLAATHRLKLCRGTQILSSLLLAFTGQKAPVFSTHQHGLDLLLWGYFALNLGCVCLFHSKNKGLFPFPPPQPLSKELWCLSLSLP